MIAVLLATSIAAAGTFVPGPAPGTTDEWYDSESPVRINDWLLEEYPAQSRLQPDGLEAWCADRKDSQAASQTRSRVAQVTLETYLYCAEIRRSPPPNAPASAKSAVESLWAEWWVRTSAPGEPESWRRLDGSRRYETSIASGGFVALPLDPGPLSRWVTDGGEGPAKYHQLVVVLSADEGGQRVRLREFYFEGALPKSLKLTDAQMKGATAESAALTSRPRFSVGIGAVVGGPDQYLPPAAPKLGVSYRWGRVTSGVWFSAGVGGVDIDGKTISQTFFSGAVLVDAAFLRSRALQLGPSAVAGYEYRNSERDGDTLAGGAPFVGGGLRGTWLPSPRIGVLLDPSITGRPLADGTWSAAWSVGVAADLAFGKGGG